MTAQEYSDLYSEPHHHEIQIKVVNSSPEVVFTNADICYETMTLEDSLFSDYNLRIGACESRRFSVKVVSEDSLIGQWIDVYIYTDLPDVLIDSDGNEIIDSDGDNIALSDAGASPSYTRIGRFKVFSDNRTNDRKWRELVCYDAMNDLLNTDVSDWYSGLTFPMTISSLRNSFFTYLNITQETVTLPNDSLEIQGGFDVDGGLSGKTVIEAICELNGCFGHITSSGTFKYITFDTYTEVTLDHYIDGTGTYEDYVVDNIDGVIARSAEDDVGTPSATGTMSHPYIINDNPLTYGIEGTNSLKTALYNVYTSLRRLMIYRPFSVTTYGNPFLEVGTKITIDTRDQTIESFVFCKTMTGIQALRDNISALGDKTLEFKPTSLPSQLIRTKGKLHILENTVDGLKSEVIAVSQLSIPIVPITDYTVNVSNDTVIYEITNESQLDFIDITQSSFRLGIKGIDLSSLNMGRAKKIQITKGTTVLTANIKNADGSNVTSEVIKDAILYLEYGTRTINGTTYSNCFWVLPDSYSQKQIETTRSQIVQTANDIRLEVSDEVKSVVDNTIPVYAVTRCEYNTYSHGYTFIIEDPPHITYSECNADFRFGIKVPEIPSAYVNNSKMIQFEFHDGSNTNYVVNWIYMNKDNPTLVSDQIVENDIVYFEYYQTMGATGFYMMTDKYAQSQIDMTSNKIVLKVDNNGNIVQVALGADASTGSVFTVNANNINLSASDIITLMAGGTITLGGQNGVIISGTNFSVDANGNATLTGTITATSGQIGGWTIGTNKIYAGDNSTGVAVMQKPTSNTTWVFGAGGTRHDSYLDCPFKVSKNGSVFAKYLNLNDGTHDTMRAPGTAYIGWDAADQAINMVVYNRQGSGLIGFRGSTGNITCHDLDTDEINLRSGYLRWVNAVSDWATIRAGAYGGASDEGYLNIATGDNGNEEIIVTQNTGAYNTPTEVRRATLLSDTGNTRFPGRVAAVGFDNTSSRKVKKNIDDISLDEAEKILQLRPVKFDFKSVDTDNQDERGFIAEEVEDIYPNLISEEQGVEGEPGFVPKSLNYIGMIPYLVKMIQQQQEEIDNLKCELNKLSRKDG